MDTPIFRQSPIHSLVEISALKVKTSTILPIILAIILPGLSFYSNSDSEAVRSWEFYIGWPAASVMIYILWQIYWNLWEGSQALRRPIIWILIGLFVICFFTIYFLNLPEQTDEYGLPYFFRIVLVSVLFLAIQYALRVQQKVAQLQLEKEQIQTENYRVQLNALQAKVDPHFLFNALNTLRSMVRQGHSNSEDFILNLSGFFRQTLKHNENSTIKLSEELAVLESYLFLMKNRNEEAVQVKIDIDNSLLLKHVPTLALQVTTENCFKHNSMTSKQPLKIEINSEADEYIIVRNNVQPKLNPEESTGYGLDLLKKRYDLMNIQDGLLIDANPDHFTVKLKLITP